MRSRKWFQMVIFLTLVASFSTLIACETVGAPEVKKIDSINYSEAAKTLESVSDAPGFKTAVVTKVLILEGRQGYVRISVVTKQGELLTIGFGEQLSVGKIAAILDPGDIIRFPLGVMVNGFTIHNEKDIVMVKKYFQR